jgi:hypothetical protein
MKSKSVVKDNKSKSSEKKPLKNKLNKNAIKSITTVKNNNSDNEGGDDSDEEENLDIDMDNHSEYQNFLFTEINTRKEDNPSLSITAIVNAADKKWCEIHPEHATKSQYQRFIIYELKNLRTVKPKLSNKKYMTLAAKSWTDFKKQIGLEPDSRNKSGKKNQG